MILFMRRVIKGIYFRFALPFHWIIFYKKRFFKFIFPNFSKIIQKKIKFTQYPVCNQKTQVSGQGTVMIGKGCIFGYRPGGHFYKGIIDLQPRYKEANILIGNNVKTNNNLIICSANHIEIGDNTLIGEGVTILDHEAHGLAADKRNQLGEIGKIIIGRNVWLGNKVTVLKNSEIGDNTIVATGAIVSSKFPANVIIGGIPAKIIKEL